MDWLTVHHGNAPVHLSHPAYRYMRDGDGIVGE